ncbi:MAG: heparinase II/III family protein, partial [Paracoccaceae bacterium]
GWRPEMTGRRLTRWSAHAPAILEAAAPAEARAFLRSLGRQTRYLQRQWRRAPAGLARFQAAAGLVHAGLLFPKGAALGVGVVALGREAERRIGADGGVASRNPEQLAEIFAALVWAAKRIEDTGAPPAPAHAAALTRLAAAIRALRLGDGALARSHGGGGGDREAMDRALTASGLKHGAPVHETMGYHRIASSRTIAIFDAGEESATRREAAPDPRHASIFSFEASIKGRPLVVNCGPGAPFGEAWRLASEAAAAHSGLSLDSGAPGGDESAPAAPGHVSALREADETGVWLIAEHDGWLHSHGLVHQRRIWLSADGGDMRGEDRLNASGPAAHAAFDLAAGRNGGTAVPFTIRFHLHPDVEAEMFLAGSAVRIRPGTGDVWVMRQSGGHIAIEESVYLDEGRGKPRATKQIVVRGRAAEYRGEVRWTFRLAEQDKPGAAGDAARADA